MYVKNLARVGFVTAAILLIPLFGTLYVEGWNWSAGDFMLAGVVLFGTGLAFDLARSGSGSLTYKIAVAVALGASFLLAWGNAAVGLIGDDNPVNMLYALIIAIGIIGAILTRSEAAQMSRILFTMAIMQMLVPVVGLWLTPDNFSPGVIGVFTLSTFFAALFAASGFLFARAGAGEKQTAER